MLFNITQHTRAKPLRNAIGIIFSIAIASTTGVFAQSLNAEIRKVHLYGPKNGQEALVVYKLDGSYIEESRVDLSRYLSELAGTDVSISFEQIDLLWAAERYALSEFTNIRSISVTPGRKEKTLEVTLDSRVETAEEFFCALDYLQQKYRNRETQATADAAFDVVFKRSNFIGYDNIDCLRQRQKLVEKFEGRSVNRSDLAIMGQSIFQNEVSGCRPRKNLMRTLSGNYELFRCSTTIDGEKLLVAFDGIQQPKGVIYINRLQEVDILGKPSQSEIMDMAIQHYGDPIKETRLPYKTYYDWEDSKGTSLTITSGFCNDPNISIRCSTGYIDYTLTAGDFVQVIERLKAAYSEGQTKQQKF